MWFMALPSSPGSTARSSTARSIPAITVSTSTWANMAPMHRRTPPPNGIQAFCGGEPSSHRSGRNRLASAPHNRGSHCTAPTDGSTATPAGRR